MMRWIIALIVLSLCACSSGRKSGVIAELREHEVDLSEVPISSGMEQAMAGYRQFLERADAGSRLTPEAIRRLADLKLEKEYGQFEDAAGATQAESSVILTDNPAEVIEPTEAADGAEKITLNPALTPDAQPESRPQQIAVSAPAEKQTSAVVDEAVSPVAIEAPQTAAQPLPQEDDLAKAGPLEAITLYQRLLEQYPLYERNDQVLYQMSRAYEELGRIEDAMVVMDRLVATYPQSRYIDEVQFRRAENFFTRRRFLDAEDAYGQIVKIGETSAYYPLALYKLGWTFYKQELYEDALDQFIGLLDYKVSIGSDFTGDEDPLERKRIDDAFRAISLSFSYLGGAVAAEDFFATRGPRDYEYIVYRNLAEYYLLKRRYSDAVASYSKFNELYPFHQQAPLFALKIIEVNTAGGFPSLVIEAKKSFARNYGLAADYWQHFDRADRPEVISGLKSNLIDLANHYHALYQDPEEKKSKAANMEEAVVWYQEFLSSFAETEEAPEINYQLADLYLENRSWHSAALEYEKTSYHYQAHERSAKAGYSAVYAWRQQLEAEQDEQRSQAVRREVIRSSLTFVDTYQQHEKADVVLGAAADDLYVLNDYPQALRVARQVLADFPQAGSDIARSAWLVVAHSSYELSQYADAEEGYLQVLERLDGKAKSRQGLIDNLASTIYRQGEQANSEEDYAAAADHFLRVGRLAPTSAIRSTADYDAATAYIQYQNWDQAILVLNDFRQRYPEHEQQAQVTKKLAYVYRQAQKPALAASEFERIDREADDPEVRREALQLAAELYIEAQQEPQALQVYERYIESFSEPLDIYIETCQKVADFYHKFERRKDYLAMLERIVNIDAKAGPERSDRTMFLAAKAGLVLTEIDYRSFSAISLVKPFETNLKKKRTAMKALIKKFSGLIDYEVGEVSAASTWYLAEIYFNFSQALMDSERPAGLDDIEMEDYELAIEEQAWPFEEKAISVHQSNLELIGVGIYNSWIDKSLERLAHVLPARYGKTEVEPQILPQANSYTYGFNLAVAVPAVAETGQESTEASINTEPSAVDEPVEVEQ